MALPFPFFRAVDANGRPLSGAKLYFYESGGLVAASVYTTDTLSVAHPQPVVADSGGLFAPIYLDPTIEYRVILKKSDDTQIDEIDPLPSDSEQLISTLLNGVTFRLGYNPGDITSWSDTSANENYEGLSVDVGGYGTRAFGPDGIPTAVNGSIAIPSDATTSPHAVGTSGYAKSSSTTTGAVALYGEGNVAADSVLAWGINTRVQDNGYAAGQIWGYECDVNVTHAGTVAVGVDAVGASTAGPNAASAAFRVGPIGTFENPAIPWGRGFFSDDGSTQIGMEIGALSRVGDTGATSKASQPVYLYYLDGSGARTRGLNMQVLSSGVTVFDSKDNINLTRNGTLVAAVVSGGVDLQSGKVLTVNAVQVVGARDTGWAADTGTARKAANATYGAGSSLTFSATYVQAEHTAVGTRLAAIETALQNLSQTQKSIKDALIAHGLIGS